MSRWIIAASTTTAMNGQQRNAGKLNYPDSLAGTALGWTETMIGRTHTLCTGSLYA
jgi:hypothetical protein